jgi:hypothetical protein
MGRPVNKNKLQTLVAYTPDHNGQVIRQIGTRKFVLDNGNTYKLVAAEPAANEMVIIGELDDGTELNVVKIASRKITASDGNTYSWVVSDFRPEMSETQIWLRTWVWYVD